MRSLSSNGFSLIEAIVAGVIFTIAITGVFASLSAIKQPVAAANQKLNAAYCGQQFLETMRARVDKRNWDNTSAGNLGIGVYTISGGALAAFPKCVGMTNITYTVTDAGNQAKKVSAVVTWP